MLNPEDVLANLAANLAEKLLAAGAAKLTALAFGDAETRSLRRLWQQTFADTLATLTADLEKAQAELVKDLLTRFVQTEGVPTALLDVAFSGDAPPLALLREKFDAPGGDRDTPVLNFDAFFGALAAALSGAILVETTAAKSPLAQRFLTLRVAAIHALLRGGQQSLADIAATVTRLESQLNRGKYQIIFLGNVSGVAIGDNATASVSAEFRPLLDNILALLTEIARAKALPPPYTTTDRDDYLNAVIGECETVHLPYADEGVAGLPLTEIYVALRADPSSPVERKASHALLWKLAQAQSHPKKGGVDEKILYRLQHYDPYAALYRIYDPTLSAQLGGSDNQAEKETYHLAELIRQHQWFVLLGDPGSGKSTLSRWLALQLARAVAQERENVTVPARHVRPDASADGNEPLGAARLPVLVRIADYAAARWSREGVDTKLALESYLGKHISEKRLADDAKTIATHALIKDYFHSGKVTFILDGLDEVTNLTGSGYI